jgi:very-short-patch-repair endonuclease
LTLVSGHASPKERGEIENWKGEEDMFSNTVNDKEIPGYITTDSVTYKTLKEFTKLNKRNQTKAEEILWNALRNRKLGYKFRTQHAIDNYVVDFACLMEKCIVEVDGGYHQANEQVKYDKERTEALEILGYREIRFKNEAVINNIDDVTRMILNFVNKKFIDQNSPLLWREGDDHKS